jgi:hypothetical protein
MEHARDAEPKKQGRRDGAPLAGGTDHSYRSCRVDPVRDLLKVVGKG